MRKRLKYSLTRDESLALTVEKRRRLKSQIVEDYLADEIDVQQAIALMKKYELEEL